MAKKEKSGKAHWQDLPVCDRTFEEVLLGSGLSHPTHGDGVVVHCSYSKCLRNGKSSKCRSAITIMFPITGKNQLLTINSFIEQGWKITNNKEKEVVHDDV